jgi:hypothetical protein
MKKMLFVAVALAALMPAAANAGFSLPKLPNVSLPKLPNAPQIGGDLGKIWEHNKGTIIVGVGIAVILAACYADPAACVVEACTDGACAAAAPIAP